MDTLGREALETGYGIFKYKETVDVPSLAMIDDVMGMSACGDASIELNTIINAKCYKIHICKKIEKCTQVLKVHENKMKNATQATYLGDVISDQGTIDETISQRSQKALGIITQISSILSSICLGNFHFEIALVLRDALFVNSIMVNSEVWHNVQVKHIHTLEKMDINLLKKVLNAHSKTASEAFFLELGRYPLKYVLSKRRLMYLWHVLHRDKAELIRKVYETQKLKHCKGDWFEIIESEKSKYDITVSDCEIAKMSKDKFKCLVESKIKASASQWLKGEALKHSKSRKIAEEKYEKKAYFSDTRFSKEDIQLLFSLKTKMTDCKTNFSMMYGGDLKCRICKVENSEEDENHLLICPILNTENHDVKFDDVYSDIDSQYRAVKVFKKVLRRRNVYLEIIEKKKPSHQY